MPLSCGSGDPSREEISKGFVLLQGNVQALVGFNRALLALLFFFLLWGGARGFGRESTRGKLLLHRGQALQCWAGVWVHAEARDQPEPCSSWPRGGVKTTQILQDCFPQLQFSSLFALRSAQGRHCSPKPRWSLPAGFAAAPVQGCKSQGCKSEQGGPSLAVGSCSCSALKPVFARGGVVVGDGSSMFAALLGWGEPLWLCCDSRHPSFLTPGVC